MQTQQSIFPFPKAGGLCAQAALTVRNSQILIPVYMQILSVIITGNSCCLLYFLFPKRDMSESYLVKRVLHLH